MVGNMKRRKFVYQSSAFAALVQVGCSSSKNKVESGDTSLSDGLPATDTGDGLVGEDTADSGQPAWDDFEAPEPPGSCEETQIAQEGPYYIEEIPIRNDLDLYNEEAQKIIVFGYVCNSACQPIPNAVVEVWHADSQGAYDLESPEMKYYGQLAADENGFYRFKTILPGAYATSANDYRPKHYHIKIWVDGEVRLTTQLYFKDDPFLEYEPNTPESLMLEVDSQSPCLTRYDFTLKD